MATMRTGSTCKKFACERKEKSKTHFFAKIKLFIISFKLMFKVQMVLKNTSKERPFSLILKEFEFLPMLNIQNSYLA